MILALFKQLLNNFSYFKTYPILYCFQWIVFIFLVFMVYIYWSLFFYDLIYKFKDKLKNPNLERFNHTFKLDYIELPLSYKIISFKKSIIILLSSFALT